jgi:cytoskeletal protein CcmA (bactofilin family)
MDTAAETRMGCFPESSWAGYVEGRLEPAQVRPLEAHLIRCRACRETVLALRERGAHAPGTAGETSAARPLAAIAPTPAAGGGRGRALGLAATLVALAAAVAAAGALLESGLARSTGWLGAARWSWGGAYAMAIDLVFLVRASAPTFFDLALPVAVMASASALLSFALSALRRRIGGPGAKLVLAAALLVAAPPARAHFGLHEHEDVVVAAGSVHDSTLIASARNVTVDGVVEGDLVVLTEHLVVRGVVRGNVIAIAEELDVRGIVEGSLFAAGERVLVSGEVRGDAYGAGASFSLVGAGRIARDATLAAEEVVLEGRVGRDANVALAERVEARGPVGRSLRVRSERLALLPGARVGGAVEASLPVGVEPVREPGAEIAGEIRVAHRERHGEAGFARFLDPWLYAWMALHLGAAFVLGMLMHWAAPGIFALHAETPRDMLRALGIGAATLIVVPLALLAAGATIVGIPVALIGAALLATALYAGLVAVAVLVGRALVRPDETGHGGFGFALAAGLAILVVLTHLPFLGGALRAVAIVIGLGLLVERARAAWRSRPAAAAAA